MPDDLDQLAQDDTHQQRWGAPRWSGDLQNLAARGLPPPQPAPAGFTRAQEQQQRWGGTPDLGAGLATLARQAAYAPFGALKSFNDLIGTAITNDDPYQRAYAGAELGYDIVTGGMGRAEKGALGIAGGKPWTPQETAILKRMVDTGRFDKNLFPGRTAAQISEKMEDIASQPIADVRPGGARSIAGDPQKIDQLLMMMSKQNMTLPQMAERLGVGERTLRRYLNENLNVRLKGQAIWNNPQLIAQYKDLIAKGFLPQQMARKLGVPETTIYDNLRALSRSGHLNYVPEGGMRTPGMPKFSFQDEIIKGDPDYERSLLQYLRSRQ